VSQTGQEVSKTAIIIVNIVKHWNWTDLNHCFLKVPALYRLTG